MNVGVFAFKLKVSDGGLEDFLIESFIKIEFVPIGSHIESNRDLFVLLAKR